MSSYPPTQPPEPPEQPQSAPAYSAAPPVAPGQPQTSTPGKTLGIVSLILAFFLPIIGLILGIVAVIQSRKAGAGNIPGIIAIILGAIFTIIWVFILIAIFSAIGSGVEAVQACLDGAATVEVLGVPQDCEQLLEQQYQ
ncbi:DUF4190 domain-containing protein [Leucobacter weissii]|uniref:DUF4190 domain-containing protein n=1 Tax=Leucobacter weissii TaxID=1983706 RepID=A0A939S9D8_9MICO|nr:DUF4190 domain-containing protein [Leucobacter weissii]MBO1903041.1 DUF4190 domain-containing protein [Leucobacter weissii]